MDRPLIVRCNDCMVFEIDRKTYEAKSCSYYDVHCFIDPRNDVDYIPYIDWLLLKDILFKKQNY